MAEVPDVPKAVFTEELNVANAGQSAYTNLIQTIRYKLGNLSNRKSHNLPVLPDQEAIPTKWFDITLQNNNSATRARAVKLRIRVGNLYLDGYQTQNTTTGKFDKWYEFKKQSNEDQTKLIDGSTVLSFTGHYEDMTTVAGVTSLQAVSLSKQDAVKAINDLNNTVPWTGKDNIVAASLLAMTLMICESTRFTLMSDFLGVAIHSNAFVKLDARKDKIIRSWKDLSEELLKMDADPNYKFNFPDPTGITGIKTYIDAVEVLGILLGDKAKATVVVTLVNPTVTNVYGLIDTRYVDNLGTETKSVLFHKESKELIDVTPGDGKIVVLSESVVDDVPLNSSLVVKADLKDQDGHVIAQDHAEFPAHLSGTFEKQISGEHGEIHVKVTWI